MDNLYVVSPTVALVTSVLLQVLKNSALFPWLNRNTGKLNASISLAVAFFTSLGIVFSFDMGPDGTFAGEVHGNLYDVLHALGHSVIQWSEQHLFYKGLIVPAETLGEIRAILEANQTAMVTGVIDTTTKVPPKP